MSLARAAIARLTRHPRARRTRQPAKVRAEPGSLLKVFVHQGKNLLSIGDDGALSWCRVCVCACVRVCVVCVAREWTANGDATYVVGSSHGAGPVLYDHTEWPNAANLRNRGDLRPSVESGIHLVRSPRHTRHDTRHKTHHTTHAIWLHLAHSRSLWCAGPRSNVTSVSDSLCVTCYDWNQSARTRPLGFIELPFSVIAEIAQGTAQWCGSV